VHFVAIAIVLRATKIFVLASNKALILCNYAFFGAFFASIVFIIQRFALSFHFISILEVLWNSRAEKEVF
jgi:hypothetical protein